jgi:hypothetical protein
VSYVEDGGKEDKGNINSCMNLGTVPSWDNPPSSKKRSGLDKGKSDIISVARFAAVICVLWLLSFGSIQSGGRL